MGSMHSIAALIHHANHTRIHEAFADFQEDNQAYLAYPEKRINKVAEDLGIPVAAVDELKFITYQYEPQKSLLEAVLLKSQRKSDASVMGVPDILPGVPNIFVVHPLYARLAPYITFSTDEQREQEQGYLATIKKILKLNLDDEANVFLLDSINGYAAVTSRLMDQGGFCKYIPTFHNRGAVLAGKYFSSLPAGPLYLCGAFNGRCLQGAIGSFQLALDEVLGEYFHKNDVFAIRDACINSPQDVAADGGVVWPPTEIYDGDGQPLPAEQIVLLEEIML